MAYITSENYKRIIYSGEAKHKIKILFDGIELEDADVFCEKLTVSSRIVPNCNTRFSLDNFISNLDITNSQIFKSFNFLFHFFQCYFPKDIGIQNL